MPVTADSPAPYSPGSTILEVLDRHRNRGLPSPINAEVLGRAGIANTLIPRVLQSLQALDLIDDQGAPTATLEGLRRAPETEYRNRLAEWLKGTYADVFTFVDPLKDDDTRIRDAFRNYQPVGQQPRMVSLFQALCSAAGLARDKSDAASPRPAARPRPAPRTTTRGGFGATGSAAAAARQPAPKKSSGLPPALSGLLESLPDPADGWSATERDRFMATFKAVLDYSIPVTTAKKMQEDGG